MSDGRIFVAEITVVVDANGTEETFYFSTAPFTTSPSDTPANKPIQALLKNPGSMRYDLFSQGRLTGLVTPNYGIMSLANPYDANGKGVLDDWINYGVSNGKVTLRIGTPGDAYPSAWKTVYIARVYKIVVSEEVQITLRDRSQLLNKPVITDVFTGSGGEEGTGAGIGRKKAIVISGSFYIPPILINAQKQIYFVQANSEGGFRTARFTQLNTDFSEAFATYDNGIELTAEPDYSSFTEMESNSPSEGCVRFYFGTDSKYAVGWKNGPVYFRVGSPPAGELRISVIGYPSDNDFEVEGFANGSWQDKYLLYRAGFTPDDIDLDSEGIGLTEQYVYEDETFLEVLSNSCLVRQGFFGFTKLDKFRAGYLRDPDDDDYYAGVPDGVFSSPRPVIPTTSLFSFTEESYRNLQNQPVPGQEIPVWAVTVNCFKTFPINEVAGGTIPLIRDYLTRQPYWITFKAYSDTTRIANPNAENVEIEVPSRDFPNDFTIKLFSYRYFHLYGGNPKTFTIETELRDDLLDLELHDVVTLQTPRFGLSAGVKTRIIGMEIDCVSRVMRFTLWIPGRGQFTGNTSPLEPGSEAYNQNQQTKQLVNKIGKVQFPPFTLRTSATMSLNTGNESINVSLPNFSLVTAATLEVIYGFYQNFFNNSPTTVIAHNAGDLIVLIQRAPNDTSVPTLVTGFTNIHVQDAEFGLGHRVSYLIDTSNAFTTFSPNLWNTSHCCILVYPGATGIGALNVSAEGYTASSRAVPILTLEGSGSTVVSYLSTNQNLLPTPEPTGMTKRADNFSPNGYGGGRFTVYDIPNQSSFTSDRTFDFTGQGAPGGITQAVSFEVKY